MVVDVWFYDGKALVKKGAVFLNSFERKRISAGKGDIDRGLSSASLFLPRIWTAVVARSGL